jgi:short-subunit dehydrogenase
MNDLLNYPIKMSRRIIEGSRILITGASSGIGRAVSLELARQGAELVVVARREDRLKKLADEVIKVGGRIETIADDITDPECRQNAIDAAIKHYNGLDILINNAGVGAMGLFEHANPARVRRVFEVNFFALVELTRLALPLLKKGVRPMIVNVSSILGHRAVPHSSEYSASKFAVQGFSEAIRAEFAKHGIDVLVVSPGTTETEFFDSVIERTGEPAWPKHTPISSAEVARRMVLAIRRGKHEIVPYFPGKILCWLNRLSPALMDRYLAKYA